MSDNPMLSQPFRIETVHRESYDTFTVELQPTNGHDSFLFAPGQYNMLYVFGVGEVPISISGDPDRPENLMHTTRAVGTVTKAMAELQKGDVIGIRGPYGTSWPVDRAEGYDVVFVAGGIGLAPLRPALYHVLAHRDRYGKVVLLYGTRSPDDILYRSELEQWRSRFDLEVHVTVDYADATWRGNVGVVTSLIPKAPFDPLHSMAMICGPEVMMRFTAIELLKRGIEHEHIYLTMERNMKCAIGFCGHCQFGQHFVCRDGPVFSYAHIGHMLSQWEV
ncbi:MAG: Ni/Fe hydrogenase subunit gamma [Chloroflexi bacterium]|nr:Ni/Fe hydrogenase subunit gamma [Chloroflexota bacterium]